jgi:hypothetical protein
MQYQVIKSTSVGEDLAKPHHATQKFVLGTSSHLALRTLALRCEVFAVDDWMMMQMGAAFLAAGANRHPSAADWDESGVLAFGADRNVALWRPQVRIERCVKGPNSRS